MLRGFALLGILLMNIEAFVGPLMDIASPGVDPALHWCRPLDGRGDLLCLVQGKFYHAVLAAVRDGLRGDDGARQRDRPPVAPGCTCDACSPCWASAWSHALLVWSGDILLTYALLGFVLLLCFRRHAGLAPAEVGRCVVPAAVAADLGDGGLRDAGATGSAGGRGIPESDGSAERRRWPR